MLSMWRGMELPNFSNKKYSINIRLVVGHELLHHISPEMNFYQWQAPEETQKGRSFHLSVDSSFWTS